MKPSSFHKKYFIGSLVVLLCFFTSVTFAQYSKYIVILKDKKGTAFTLANPSAYLSAKAIARRTRFQIAIDSTDLPVSKDYLDSIAKSGAVTILNTSKWLNQVCIFTTDQNALNKINSFSFVVKTQPLKHPLQNVQSANKFDQPKENVPPLILRTPLGNYYDYGNSYAQIHIHEGEFLHNNGFHGEGMSIAIIDAGFYHYLSLSAFDSIRQNNQIKETYDFVHNKVSVDEENTHGMNCLSIIAGNIPSQLVGSCPKASFYLYKSEDVDSEYPIEEQNWVAAAERADSAGADVLSTSLGYTTFDNPVFNHTYQQMNGTTTIIARGNVFAAKKGMISVVAAGNDGNSAWHYISTPADADNILTVGAVDATGVVASFSSYGPSADGRIKPDVASVGVATAIEGANNVVTSGNGTSFATPNIAGLVTCLWQAFPEFSNLQIIDVVKKSSSIYTMPDNRIGYGIPNFHTAYNMLLQLRVQQNNTALQNDWIKAYPNPFNAHLFLTFKPSVTGKATINIYDFLGKLILTDQVNIVSGQTKTLDFSNIPLVSRATYTIQYKDDKNKRSIKVLKQ